VGKEIFLCVPVISAGYDQYVGNLTIGMVGNTFRMTCALDLYAERMLISLEILRFVTLLPSSSFEVYLPTNF